MHPQFIEWLEKQEYTFYMIRVTNSERSWCIKTNQMKNQISMYTWGWKEILV
jgi:hypothetical protein